MRKFLNIKIIADIALWVMVIGGIALALGIGSCLYIARQEISKETNLRMETAVTYVQSFVDSYFMHIEDVGYTMIGNALISEDGRKYVVCSQKYLKTLTEEKVYEQMEQLLKVYPSVCGVALSMNAEYAPFDGGQYGNAIYVANENGKTERYNIGKMYDFTRFSWYKEASETRNICWNGPFKETFNNRVVTCFSIPIMDVQNSVVGVFAIEINADNLRNKCIEEAPFSEAKIAICNEENLIIAYPDTTKLMHNIDEVLSFDDKDNFSVKTQNARTGWTIAISCPKKIIFESINRMRHQTAIIAWVCILIMFVCLVWFFRRVQRMTLSKAGMEKELHLASAIQQGFLTKKYPAFPERKELDINAYLKPAKEIGGDFYDYLIRDDKCYFCVGDVSGKGMPASLFMAIMYALFRHVSQSFDNPSKIMQALNKTLSENNERNMFCTMFVGIMDLKSGKIDYCNAGHNAPIIMQKNNDQYEVSYLNVKANMALGIDEQMEYETASVTLEPQDALFLYTDGVVEAENGQQQVFGDNALLQRFITVRKNSSPNVRKDIEEINTAIRDFAGKSQQSDDITMLEIQYTGMSSHLHLTNDIHQIPQMSKWLEEIGGSYNLNHDRLLQINLAIEEIVANCMQYAYPGQTNQPIDVYAQSKNNMLIFVIDDQGVPFDPTKVESPDITLSAEERTIGGLGILLTLQLAEDVSYERCENHNRLTLTFNR